MIFKKYGHIRTRLDEMMELDKFWKGGLVDIKLYDKFGKFNYYKEPEFGSLGSFRFITRTTRGWEDLNIYGNIIPLPKGKGKTIKFKRRLHPLGEGEIGHSLFDYMFNCQQQPIAYKSQAELQDYYCRR
ncbi:MAG: hypothetical protein WC389_15910 [Lutibacter sp.]|jgi:hypothetical protein